LLDPCASATDETMSNPIRKRMIFFMMMSLIKLRVNIVTIVECYIFCSFQVYKCGNIVFFSVAT